MRFNPIGIRGFEALKASVGGARWRQFFGSGLWLGVPVVAGSTFLIFIALFYWGEGLPMARALAKSAVFAALQSFCWILGIWASTTPEEPGPDAGEDAASRYLDRLPQWLCRVLGTVLVLVALGLLFLTQIEDLVTGEASAAKALGGILIKALGIAMVIVPSLLAGRRA